MSSKKENLFAKLAQQKAHAEQPAAVDPAPALEVVAESAAPSPALSAAPLSKLPKAKTAAARPKAELSAGKRLHPDFCQANAYVPKTLRKEVTRALLDEEDMDFSMLVEDLLRKWLKSRGIVA